MTKIDKQQVLDVLLKFAESIANHTSRNLHGFYSGEVKAARAAVKLAGGILKEMGRFRAGESLPMTHEEYSKRKAERKVERVLQALLSGPVQFISNNIYDINNKRVCTHSELVTWIRESLKAVGYKLEQHGRLPGTTWTMSQSSESTAGEI